jgi:hypothetical protein
VCLGMVETTSSPSSIRRIHVLDLAYILIALLFFVAMWGLTKACERL